MSHCQISRGYPFSTSAESADSTEICPLVLHIRRRCESSADASELQNAHLLAAPAIYYYLQNCTTPINFNLYYKVAERWYTFIQLVGICYNLLCYSATDNSQILQWCPIAQLHVESGPQALPATFVAYILAKAMLMLTQNFLNHFVDWIFTNNWIWYF